MTPPRRTNGGPVSRAELGAHLERIDAQLCSLHEKVDAISEQLARPHRWLLARFSKAVDWGLIAGLMAALAYIATHSG